MMLQTIHHEMRPPRASSIYCRWIRNEQGEGPLLVAVWIDSEMRSFEQEFASSCVTETVQEGALEEPGGVRPQQLFAHAIMEISA